MPPKSATRGQKQIDKENESSLKFYKHIVIVANVTYLVIRLLVLRSSVSWWNYVILCFTSLSYFGAYSIMSSMAAKGIDLNVDSGMAEHAKDILLLTAIVQMLNIISNYFILLLLLAPARAFYLLWVHFLGPWFFAAPPEVDEKAMKKMEKKMKRQNQYVR